MLKAFLLRKEWAGAEGRIRFAAYWGALVALIVLKCLLVSDLTVKPVLAPHDDSQYVTRAFHLLGGDAFGPFDSHTLSKLPGLSLWLAGVRSIGLPHLLAINALYVAAGLYLLNAMGKAGMGRWLRTAIFAAYLFNPLTMGEEWIRVLREPLATGLLVTLLASMLHLILNLTARMPVLPHLLVLTFVYAFALLVREEDRLLWAALAMFGAAVVRSRWTALVRGEAAVRNVVIAAMLLPAGAALVTNYMVRSYVEDHYGLPVVHDLGEGEFPRLMAAIRGIQSSTDNRLVMVPQDVLQRLRSVIPEFAPVVDRLPTVGPDTLSCNTHGVCKEWSNGWMPFWIKDAASEAGLTPSQKAAQQYFRRIRESIEKACMRGELKCNYRGSGLIPPFELRWTRAYVGEFSALLKMTLSPDPHTVREPLALYNVSLNLGRMFQAVTMTSYLYTPEQKTLDTLVRRPYRSAFADLRKPWENIFRPIAALLIVIGAFALICRWTLYPNVAESPLLLIATLFFAFALFRITVLAYIAVFMGHYEPRIAFPTHSGAILMAPVAIFDLVRAFQLSRKHMV
jgi:hypothetical protein